MLRLVHRCISGASTRFLQKKKLLFMDRLAELMVDDSHDERLEIAGNTPYLSPFVIVKLNETRGGKVRRLLCHNQSSLPGEGASAQSSAKSATSSQPVSPQV